MKKLAAAFVIVFSIASAGCYHAVINTGLTPGSKVIRKTFRPSFIGGLVPPPKANVEGKCSTGVARVETTHRFIEGLLAIVTGGIFTPMTYVITCASGSAAVPSSVLLHVARGDTAALTRAAALAARTGHPIYVRF